MTAHNNYGTHLSCYWSKVKYISFLLFVTSNGILFTYLNRVYPYYFVDEAFHIPQTLRYCDGNFTEWDPKITTLPGLYFITALILSPLNLCDTIHIRSVNLFGTFLNLYLTYLIIKEISKIRHMHKWSDWMQLAVAYNITLLPPLFFWCFLYYTDVVGVNTVLLMSLLHLREYFKTAAFVGLMSILIRQTNIIWVVYLAIERALDLLDAKIKPPVHSKHVTTVIHIKLLWKIVIREASYGTKSFVNLIIHLCSHLYPYIIVGLAFLSFVIWNGGIVVGDRSAHIPTVHIPQILYFSIFVFCFSWPYMIVHGLDFFYSVKKHWVMTSCVCGCMATIIHCNTLIHPYLLADNRHYAFYVWSKFMGKYVICKYLLIPVYCFTIYTMFCCIRHLRFLTQINYVISVCIVLIPQLLFEPRYFIIPYILFRLSIRKPQVWQICLESLTIIFINFVQFFIFVNKVFYWEDQDYPQRIGW